MQHAEADEALKTDQPRGHELAGSGPVPAATGENAARRRLGSGLKAVAIVVALCLAVIGVLWMLSADQPSAGGEAPTFVFATRPPRSTGVFAPTPRPSPTPKGALTPASR